MEYIQVLDDNSHYVTTDDQESQAHASYVIEIEVVSPCLNNEGEYMVK